MAQGLTGTLAADFTSWTAAVDGAVIQLKMFEANSFKVSATLNKMGDSFSGNHIIQQAGLMAKVFTDAGGAASFTRAELARMGAVGGEAFEKLIVTGQRIPPNLQAMVEATRRVGTEMAVAAPRVNNLRAGLGAFDGVLASLGIRMGPEIRALGELGDASGKTGAEMGGLAKAGLVAGAAIAGWKVGRAAAEFFDLDEKIGNATAKLLGWGDVVAQETGAKLDVLVSASLRAGRTILDFNEAVAVNIEFLAKQRDAVAAAAKKTADFAEAMRLYAEQKVKDTAIQIQNEVALANLAKQFGQTTAAKERDTAATKDATSAQTIYRDGTKFTTEVIGENTVATDKLTAAKKKQEEADKAAAAAATVRAMGGSTQYDLGTDEGRAKVPAQVALFLHDGYSFEQAMRLAYAMANHFTIDGSDPLFRSKGPRVPGFLEGGPTGQGGLSLLHQGEYVVPKGGALVRSGGGGATTVNVNVQVSGVWDPASARKLADVVSTELARSVRQGQKLGVA